MNKLIFFFWPFLLLSKLQAQDSLSGIPVVESNEKFKIEIIEKENDVKEVFLGTRVMNFQTTENRNKKTLSYRIMHRFGNFVPADTTQGVLYNFLGLDGPASINFQVDYSITDNWGIGVGRTSWDKMYQVYSKYKILSQTKDEKMPLSLGVFAKANISTGKFKDLSVDSTEWSKFTNHVDYVGQVLISRKIGERIGIEINPTWLHYNLNWRQDAYGALETIGNDIFALTGGISVKVKQRMALTIEYAKALTKYADQFTLDKSFFDHLGIGLDIRTGGHMFQFFLINSLSIDEIHSIPFNFGDLTKGKFRIGFNIQRDFNL